VREVRVASGSVERLTPDVGVPVRLEGQRGGIDGVVLLLLRSNFVGAAGGKRVGSRACSVQERVRYEVVRIHRHRSRLRV